MKKLNTPINAIENNLHVNGFQDEREAYVGVHVIAEFWECRIEEDVFNFEAAITEAARKANCELLKYDAHRFSPMGYTAFAILGESHISIHTWPEKQYCALDIFTCGKHTSPHEAITYLKEQLKPERFEINTIYRGKHKDSLDK